MTFSKTIYLLFLLLGLFLLLSFIALFSDSIYGQADSWQHFLISKYAFTHPHLLLDHWGKPVFTLLSSPFSQFGIKGTVFFNVLVHLLTCWFGFRITSNLGLRQAWLTILLISFAPIYFISTFSALTEPLFGLCIVAGLYLFQVNRHTASSIVLSFLPLIRTEGFAILPIFLAVLLLNRRIIPAILLCTGTLIFSVAGLFYYNDFLWLINKNPYTGAEDIYQSGEFLFYIRNYKNLIERPIAILFVLGTFFFFRRHFFRKNYNRGNVLILIIFAIICTYGLLHSFLWWQGMKGAFGLLRIMAVIAPLFGIIAAGGVSLIDRLLSRYSRSIKLGAFTLITASIVVVPFIKYDLPLQIDGEQKLIDQAAEWLIQENLAGHQLYFYHPYVAYRLDKDPFEAESSIWGIGTSASPSESLGKNGIVLWDAHFGSNEGSTPLNDLMNQPGLEFLRKFTPKEPFTTLGGCDFELYIFVKRH